jgi:hypothetical protein
MALPKITPIYDEFADFLITSASPAKILAFKPSEAAQARARELTEKNKTGTLTPEEAEELEQMMEVELMMNLLKAKAAVALKNS